MKPTSTKKKTSTKQRRPLDKEGCTKVRAAYDPVFNALLRVRHFDRSAQARADVRDAAAAFVAAVERAMDGCGDDLTGTAEVIDLRSVFAARAVAP